jgi:putative phosphoesterase
MSQILLISDSHVPSREQSIPKWVLTRIEAAPYTVHAGDFDSHEALVTIREAANDLTAVTGNIDPADIGLPSVATFDIEGVRFVVTHGTGPADGYRKRVANTVTEHAVDGPTIGVSGHTHQPMDEMADGVQLVNPGSCTGARPATTTSIATVTVESGEFTVDHHTR